MHQYIENLSLLTIGLYSIFILFDLTISQFFDVDADMMNTIDFVFLNVFFIEILLNLLLPRLHECFLPS